ncbi:MAG: hypothetical protein ACKOTE_01970, partial [Opitutaceae bacterium]
MTSGDSAPGPQPAGKPVRRSRLAEIWRRDIWLPANLKDTSPRGWLYACLRVLSISITVFVETKAPSRAAALSFSSLLSLGPLIAIGGPRLSSELKLNSAARLGALVSTKTVMEIESTRRHAESP